MQRENTVFPWWVYFISIEYAVSLVGHKDTPYGKDVINLMQNFKNQSEVFYMNQKNMKKQNETRVEQGMNRTEFAQEYSMENTHTDRKGGQAGKQGRANKTK